MADESFKIGLNFELDDSDLDKIVADIKRKIADAASESTRGVNRAGGAGRAPVIPGGSATARSIKQTIEVEAGDLPRQIQKAVADGISGLDSGIEKITQAVNELTATLKREKEARKGAPSRTAAPKAAEAEDVQSKKQQIAARLEETKRALAAAREIEESASQLAAAQKKEAAAREMAARNVQKSAPGGGARVSGAGAAPPPTPPKPPTTPRDPEKTAAARERVASYVKGAERAVEELNKDLAELRQAFSKMPGLRDKSSFEMMKGLNLPMKAEVGQGGAVTVRDFSGQVKVVGNVIDMVGGKLVKFQNVLSERIRALLDPNNNRLAEIGRTARRDPARAEGRARKEVFGLLAGLATIKPEGQPRKAFQKGGEVELRFTPTKEEQERLSALESEADIISETNRILYQRIQADKALQKQLAGYGAAGLSSVGLAEDTASRITVERGDKESGAKIEKLIMTLQSRDLATVGMGDKGGMTRQARVFLTSELSDVRGGGSPTVKGYVEEQLEEAGLYLKQGFKEFITVLASPDLIPELKNDQFLINPKVVDMAMDEMKSEVVKVVAEGIKPGAKLAQGQVIGTRGEGDAMTQVGFKLKGAEATVDRLETVFIDGIEAVRIWYKELNNVVTGSKFMDQSGIKGIGRTADFEKMGMPSNVGMVMSLEGLVKRQGLRTVAEMMAHAISDATGAGAQEIADAIVEASQAGGKEMGTVVKEVAARFGAEGFTGTTKLSGPLAGTEVLAGRMALARAPKEGQRGEMTIKDRYIDPAAMSALKGDMATAKMANQWRQNMEESTAEHDDLIRSLRAMGGEVDDVLLSLRRVRPEDLKRLPAGGAAPEDFKGTLLDPDLKDAFLMALPGEGGSERFMRVPAAGSMLGGRGSFETKVGSTMPTAITTQLDRIAEQAAKVRGITGQVPLTEGSEAMAEVAEVTSKAIRDEINAIKELGIKSKEGAQRAREFVAAFKPVIDSLEGPVGLQYRRLGADDQPAGKVETVKTTAAQYVAGQKTPMQQVIAIGDILAERSGAITGKEGSKTQSIDQLGLVHKKVEVLTKAMEVMGVTLTEDSDAAQKATGRLHDLEVGLYDMLSNASVSRTKPERVEKRSIAASAEAGSSLAPRGLAVEFRTDVSQELSEVDRLLTRLATSGDSAGEGVEEARAALERMKAVQDVGLPGISRDTVLINEKDFKNLVEAFSRRLNISESEAALRLQRTGLAHRYPTTGSQSFSPAKLQVASDEVLPAGSMGVAGPMAMSSAEDLKKMLAPLEQLRASLLKTAEDNNFEGAAALEAGRQLQELSPVLNKLKAQFVTNALNLDFDGDRIEFHGDMAREASENLRTFNQELSTGTASIRKSLTAVLADVASTGGTNTNLSELDRMFRNPKLAKGRSADNQMSTPWNNSPDRAAFESRAIVAPKTSIGLLTDAFNTMELAVRAGGDQLSGAMNGAISQMMLGMNEALAQKHGSIGATGPMEFMNMLKKGQLGQIFAAMDAGQGFFGDLAAKNKKMMTGLEADLKELRITGGAAGLMDFVAREGLGIEIDPNDLNKGIADILKQVDIRTVIVRMFEMLKKNMVSALVAGGKAMDEAEAAVADMLAPQGKNNFIKGLKLGDVVQQSFPGYDLTRKRTQTAMQDMAPMDKASAALDTIGIQMAKAAVESTDSMDFEAMVDPREAAMNLRRALSKWYTEVVKDSTSKVEFKTRAQLEQMTGLKGTGGGFARGKETMGGSEGMIYVASEFWEQAQPAIKALREFSKGTSTLNPEQLISLAKNLQTLLGVVAHEGVHRANKEFGGAVAAVVKQLLTGSGALGEFGDQVTHVLKTVHSGVRNKFAKVAELEARRSEGAKTAVVSERRALPSGGFGQVESRVGINKAVRIARAEAQRTLAEELLAYSQQPEKWADLGMDQIPKAVQDFLAGQVEILAASSGDAGKVLRETAAARQALQSNIMEGLIQASKGAPTADVSDAMKQVQNALLPITDFPDAYRFNRALELLGAHERLIIEAAAAQPGAGLSRISRKPKEEGLGLRREETDARGARLSNISSRMAELDAEIRSINQKVIAGLIDPEELDEYEKQIGKAANEVRKQLTVESKKPANAGAMGGINPRQEQSAIMREYQRNVAAAMTERARGLQAEIEEMRRAGGSQTPDFSALIEEFIATLEQLHNFAGKTLAVRGAGRGTVSSYAAGDAGELLPSAREAGVTPGGETLQSVMASVSGVGKESESFLKRLQAPIYSAVEALKNGEDHLEVWRGLFQTMIQYPDEFKTDLGKIVEIMAKFSRILGMSSGQFSELSSEMAAVARLGKEVGKAVKDTPIENVQDILGGAMGGTKGAKQALARGLGGAELAPAVDAQMEAIRARVEDRRGRLNELTKTSGYEQMGGQTFEGMKFDVIDPKSGEVLQKFGAEFVRGRGGEIVSTFKQIGAASKTSGEMLQTAFRRVVQWGFATGIIYGAARAFREMISVITNVETQMAELKKVMDTSITDFQALQDSASDMAQEFGISIEQVLEGMTVYGQQGLEMSEVNERTRATLLAVNTTTLDSKEATEALTSVMKVFNDEVGSSEGAVDAWAAVAAKHAVTAEDLAIAVQRTGAAAKASGVSFNDLLGITTAIGSVTRQSGKEVATGVKFMLQSIRRTPAQKELLGAGVKSQTDAGALRPAVEVLQDLSSRWQDLTSSQRLNIAQSIAGIRHYNQFLVLMDNWGEVLDASANAADSQGFATRKNAIALETFSKQLQVLKEGVKRVALDLGKALLPAMKLVVDAAQLALGVFNKVPDSLKAIGVGGVAAFLALHKGADLFLDTLGAFGGTELKNGLENKGIFGAIAELPSRIKGSFRGTKDVLKSFGRMPVSPQILLEGGEGAMKLPKVAEAAGELGLVAQGLQALSSGAAKAMSAWKALSTVMKASIVGAVLAGVIAVTVALSNMRKSGKEVEDDIADRVGKIEDEISTLGKQERSMRKLSSAWDDYAASVRVAADPAKLADALESGNFTGPLVALKEYKDTAYETGVALARFNTQGIEGISDTGEYIYSASAAMQVLAGSAIDAKKALIAAFQTQAIQAYTKDLKEASGFVDNAEEIFSFGTKDMSPLAKLSRSRDRLNSVAKRVQDDTNKGLATSLSLQNELNAAVKNELEARQEVALIAQDLKKSLESLPIFGDIDMASNILGTQQVREGAQTAALGGAYGREATGSSVQMSLLAKNLGLGGIIGGESTTNPQRLMQELAGKGLGLERGIAPEAGGLTQISEEAARKFLLKFGKGLTESTVSDQAVQRARTVLTGMSSVTGELVFFLEDLQRDATLAIRESEMSEEDKRALIDGYTLRREDLEEAAAKSRRLLTIQATGALAGIRLPASGMPNIGPAKARDLTVEQRLLGRLPEEMQRLSDIESELTEVQKRYNEAIGEGADVTEEAAAAITNNVRVLDRDMQKLVVSLQLEQFDLTYIAQIGKAMEELQDVFKNTALATRDARIEEEARFDFMKNSSGALAGRPVVPQIEIGKGLKELSGQERLQRDLGPGFARSLTRLAGLQGENDRNLQQVVDVRKQVADFGEMVRDLDQAGKNLTLAQSESINSRAVKQLTGADEGSQYVQREIQKQGEASLSELQKQTPVMDRMLDFLEIIADSSTGDKTGASDKLTKVKAGIAKADAANLFKLLGSAVGQTGLAGFQSSVLGLAQKEGDVGRTGRYQDIGSTVRFQSPESEAQFNELRGQLKDLRERESFLASTQGNAPGVSQALSPQITGVMEQLLQIPELADAARGYLEKLAGAEVQTRTAAALTESISQREQLKAKLLEEQARAMGLLGEAERRSIAEVQKSTEALNATQRFGLAFAISEFGNSIEKTIDEFKKAEMLNYNKVGSDLDGAFARVGQPGFRNQFENRRLELDKQGNRPMSLEDFQAREEARSQINFDEKEARIKEAQDIETAVLRNQQGQAETLRSSIADALMNNTFAGDADAEGMARNFMEQLTSELATSEQATRSGDDLTFRGIPGLQDATRFLQQIRSAAEDNARAAQRQVQIDAVRTGTSELLGVGQSSLGVQQEILKTLQAGAGAPGQPGAVPGTVSAAESAEAGPLAVRRAPIDMAMIAEEKKRQAARGPSEDAAQAMLDFAAGSGLPFAQFTSEVGPKGPGIAKPQDFVGQARAALYKAPYEPDPNAPDPGLFSPPKGMPSARQGFADMFSSVKEGLSSFWESIKTGATSGGPKRRPDPMLAGDLKLLEGGWPQEEAEQKARASKQRAGDLTKLESMWPEAEKAQGVFLREQQVNPAPDSPFSYQTPQSRAASFAMDPTAMAAMAANADLAETQRQLANVGQPPALTRGSAANPDAQGAALVKMMEQQRLGAANILGLADTGGLGVGGEMAGDLEQLEMREDAAARLRKAAAAEQALNSRDPYLRQERTFRPGGNVGGPLTDAENLKSFNNLMKLPGQEFKSANMLSPSALAGNGTVDLTSALERMPVTGRTSETLKQESIARATTGNADATFGGTPVVPDQETSGSAQAKSKAAEDKGTANPQAEALNKILAAQEATNELLSSLAENGLKLPEDFGSQIESVGTTISDKLSETLNVTVTNVPFDVNVLGLGEALSAAFTSSDLSSVGSAVRDQGIRLKDLENLLDEGKAIPAAIEAALQPVNAGLETAKGDLEEQAERLTQLQNDFEALPDMDELAGLIQTNTDLIETLTNQMGQVVGDLLPKATAAATALRDDLRKLDEKVEKNRQAAETGLRSKDETVAGAVQQIRRINTEVIPPLETKVERALQIAQTALNRPK